MKKVLMPLLALLCFSAAAVAEESAPQPGAREELTPRKLNFLMWRAFSQLGSEERATLEKLQREDPEKFRAVLKGKAEELFAAEQKRHAELRQLMAEYKAASSDAARETAKARIRAMLAESFGRHLTENRVRLADMKRRAAELEQEIEKRAANADAIIDAQTDALLEGKFFPGDRPPPPHGGRPGAKGPASPRP